ncbi:MAG: hypothetical protein HKN25_12320 [Pyrinomonadaceae bacterium]|nr:hypothetical protein [Pyrinomonadaceae bacterium]
MKKIIFLCVLLLIASSTAVLAQQRGGGSPRGNRAGANPNRNVNTADRTIRRDRTMDASNRTRTGNEANRPDIQRRKPTKVRKLLSGLNLSKRQKHKTKQILKEAKENGTPKNEVLREINSILNPRQSKKFKKKIKRIYQNKHGDSGDDNPPNDSATP